MIPTISREELKAKMDRKDSFTLVETLPAGAYLMIHLPGAINLPLKGLEERASSVLPDKSAEIVVYCATPDCHASEEAARKLMGLGYANVKDYAGGKQDWIDAGFPTAG
jgi:rhodanese-related sulfurtransferase